MRPKLDDLDSAVLSAIEKQALTPAVTQAAARRAVELIRERAARQPDTAKRLRQELTKLEAERSRLTDAIRFGGKKIQELVPLLADCGARIEAVRRELAQLEAPATLDALSDKRLPKQLAERAARWRELLNGDVPLARQALRKLLVGPVQFVAEADGYRLKGATRLGALLFDEIAAPGGETRVKLAYPRGFVAHITRIALPFETWLSAA